MNSTTKQITISGIQQLLNTILCKISPKPETVTINADSPLLLCIVKEIEGSSTKVVWNFKNGESKKASVVHVISERHLLLEEKSLLTSKPSLINVNQLSSITVVV